MAPLIRSFFTFLVVLVGTTWACNDESFVFEKTIGEMSVSEITLRFGDYFINKTVTVSLVTDNQATEVSVEGTYNYETNDFNDFIVNVVDSTVTVGKNWYHSSCTPWYSDIFATGQEVDCCSGSTKCLGQYNPWDSYHWGYVCFPDDTGCQESIPPEADDSGSQCTRYGQDPWQTGSLVECCVPYVACVQNYDGDNRWYNKCLALDQCQNWGQVVETPDDAPCAYDGEDIFKYGYEQECCDAESTKCSLDWEGTCEYSTRCSKELCSNTDGGVRRLLSNCQAASASPTEAPTTLESAQSSLNSGSSRIRPLAFLMLPVGSIQQRLAFAALANLVVSYAQPTCGPEELALVITAPPGITLTQVNDYEYKLNK